MKRIALIALFVALVFASVASAAFAQANPMVSLGIIQSGGEALTYIYGELGLTPTLTLAADYQDNQVYTVGIWHGIVEGLYSEYSSASDSETQFIEVGVWRSMSLAPSLGLTGWIGGQSELGATGIWARAGAELSIGVADSAALFAGGEMTLLKQESESHTWLGVGYYF